MKPLPPGTPRFVLGLPVSMGALQQVADLAHAAARAEGVGATPADSAGTYLRHPDHRFWCWMRLTGCSFPYYSAQEVYRDDNHVWRNREGGFVVNLAAREYNDAEGIWPETVPPEGGPIVRMELSDGRGSEGEPLWLFSRCCPPPEGDAPGSGDGPGSGPGSNPPPPAPGGACPLAKLRKSDCVLATGLGQEIKLANTGTRWAGPTPFTYDDGTGTLEFWYEAGRVHLSLGGKELLDCGDGCFSGGPLTGHPDEDTGAAPGSDSGSGTGSGLPEPCSGTVFTICLSCASCADEPDPGPEPDPVSVPCCPDVQVRGRLYATIAFTGGAGQGPCSTTLAVDVLPTGINRRWERFFHYPCLNAWLGQWQVFLECRPDPDTHVYQWIWGLAPDHGYPGGGCGGTGTFFDGEVVCSPFLATASQALTLTCFTGDPADAGTPVPFTITFTETPP